MYGLKIESHEYQALEDFISEVGAPCCIHSDNAKSDISKVWIERMRRYGIKITI